MSQSKRLILCCDGTWMDSDDGFTKPSLIPYVPTGTLQIPSNVTRISRALKRVGLDGKPQIISYHSGVGTGSSTVDTITGGLLGMGISENIREVYSFIAANYMAGDEIILIGFSRGAFTVRSVASMIRDIGLLNRRGMEYFYPIFKDQENFRNDKYNDIFPTIPFAKKPDNPRDYRERLEQDDLTRAVDPDGSVIRVQAVAVWDTVGSLGIPNIALLSKLGLPHSTREYRFYDTSLSNIVRHAFQALALDETRAPFSPAVWERKRLDNCTVDLRQVWFPGAHSNVGGGYPDQEIANISLAWMMDQLASIGVAFQPSCIQRIYQKNTDYFENPPQIPKSLRSLFSRPNPQWAIEPIYEKHAPIRPFGLGAIVESKTGFWNLAGKATRTPGLYMRADPDTGASTGVSMVHTNERIHSSVRIRLDLEGLGPGDAGTYKCPALLQSGPWRLTQRRLRIKDPIPWDASWGPETPAPESPPNERRWVWEYDGPEHSAPEVRVLVEDNMGPYQRELLRLSTRNESQKSRRRKRRRTPKHNEERIVSPPPPNQELQFNIRDSRRSSRRYRDDVSIDERSHRRHEEEGRRDDESHVPPPRRRAERLEEPRQRDDEIIVEIEEDEPSKVYRRAAREREKYRDGDRDSGLGSIGSGGRARY